MALEFEHILYEMEGPVAWITLDRAGQLNALSYELRDELLQALLKAQEDERAGAIVITGSGRTFSTGGDLHDLVGMKASEESFEHLLPMVDQGSRIVSLLRDCPKPVIAMINGLASGAGCNLALACDLRIAGEDAAFQQDYIKMGMVPDWGGSFFLPRLIGQGRALEMMLTGRRVEAGEAEEIGLVHQVAAAPHLREQTARLALRLAQASSTATRLIKMGINNSLENDLQSMLEFETESQRQCWHSLSTSEEIEVFTDHGAISSKGVQEPPSGGS